MKVVAELSETTINQIALAVVKAQPPVERPIYRKPVDRNAFAPADERPPLTYEQHIRGVDHFLRRAANPYASPEDRRLWVDLATVNLRMAELKKPKAKK